jgi:hypothetical protein
MEGEPFRNGIAAPEVSVSRDGVSLFHEMHPDQALAAGPEMDSQLLGAADVPGLSGEKTRPFSGSR